MKNVIGILIVLVGFLVLFSGNIASLISGQRITVDEYLDEQQRMRNQQRLFEEEQQRLFNEMQNQQMIDDFNQRMMEEATKSVTPFDEGGYVQGYGFNPSDTMAEDDNNIFQEQEQQQQQINDINNANNFNNFGNGMGF